MHRPPPPTWPPGSEPPWTDGPWPSRHPAAYGPDLTDTRERLARIETSQQHLHDWVRHVAGQSQALDERVRKIGSRVGQTADQVVTLTAQMAKLHDLPAAMKSTTEAIAQQARMIEEARALRADMIRYALSGGIVLAVLLTKGDLGAVAGILAAIFSKGAVAP